MSRHGSLREFLRVVVPAPEIKEPRPVARWKVRVRKQAVSDAQQLGRVWLTDYLRNVNPVIRPVFYLTATVRSPAHNSSSCWRYMAPMLAGLLCWIASGTP